VAQPDDVGGAEGVAKDAVVFLAGHTRVAALGLLIEEAFLRGQQGAAAIHVDAAAFEHDRLALPHDWKEPHPAPLGNSLSDAVVLLPVRVFCPSGELELGDGDLGVWPRPTHADGPEVARPAAIRWGAEEFDVGEVGVSAGVGIGILLACR
jgi:hypothetical protein